MQMLAFCEREHHSSAYHLMHFLVMYWCSFSDFGFSDYFDASHFYLFLSWYCYKCTPYVYNRSSPKSFGKSASLSHNYATKSPL